MPAPAPAEILDEAADDAVDVGLAEDVELAVVGTGEADEKADEEVDVFDADVEDEVEVAEPLARIDDESTVNHLGAFVFAATVVCVTPPLSGST